MVELSENAKTIMNKRYVMRDKKGEPMETPEDVFKRVARFVASNEEESEKWDGVFYEAMSELKFLPNSPTLVNAGMPKGSLSACFVISPDDTLESIMQVAYDAALVEKWGGGIGFGLSKIRPFNDSISSTHGKALGPIGVMSIYSHLGNVITQGSFRAGAHMAQLHCTHPDIMNFIHCKDTVNETGAFANFNISVQITSEFLNAVREDRDWNLINPNDLKVVKTIKAKEIWEAIVVCAWNTGDPGLCFIDNVRASHVNPHLGLIETSNPCAEQYLENYGSCNLASINLAKHVVNGNNKMDWDSLGDTIKTVVRFLDNVIDLNSFPVPTITEMNRKTRRIGIGVMGWADVLMEFNIPYESKEALDLANSIGSFINDMAWQESALLANERGPFPEYLNSALRREGRPPTRHSCVTSIAPTGTISRIANCSSSVEPYFALAWKSNILWEGNDPEKTTEVVDVPLPVKKMLETYVSTEKAEEIINAIVEKPSKGKEILEEYGVVDKVFDTALDISPNWHVLHQSAWQKNVTNGVSKTVNLPSDATPQDVSDVYVAAWNLGLKGITIYRSGSRDNEVLDSGAKEKNGFVLSDEEPTPIGGDGDGDSIPIGEEKAIVEEGCPDCGNELVNESNCWTCKTCGWGKCET